MSTTLADNETLGSYLRKLQKKRTRKTVRGPSKKKKARGMGKKKALSLDRASCVSGGGTPKRVVYYRCKLKKK
jgi:hypothetical protein